MSDIKQIIINTVKDLAADFLYYDRKEDEELSSDQLNEAFIDGTITTNEIIEIFAKELKENL